MYAIILRSHFNSQETFLKNCPVHHVLHLAVVRPSCTGAHAGTYYSASAQLCSPAREVFSSFLLLLVSTVESLQLYLLLHGHSFWLCFERQCSGHFWAVSTFVSEKRTSDRKFLSSELKSEVVNSSASTKAAQGSLLNFPLILYSIVLEMTKIFLNHSARSCVSLISGSVRFQHTFGFSFQNNENCYRNHQEKKKKRKQLGCSFIKSLTQAYYYVILKIKGPSTEEILLS